MSTLGHTFFPFFVNLNNISKVCTKFVIDRCTLCPDEAHAIHSYDISYFIFHQGQNGRSGHNVHLNDKSEPTSTAEFDPANDTLDFLSNRRPVDEMVKKYSNSDQVY